jgi:hypothetical protein
MLFVLFLFYIVSGIFARSTMLTPVWQRRLTAALWKTANARCCGCAIIMPERQLLSGSA